MLAVQLGRGGTLPVAVLGAATIFGGALWAVPLYLLDPGLHQIPNGPALPFLPAVLGTLALAFACGLWLGRRCRARQDEEALAAAQSRLALAQTQLRLATERTDIGERRTARLLEAAAPGAALCDAGFRLVAWNHGFPALLEVPAAALHIGLPLAELVRLQPAGEGRRLPLRSIQAGIAGAARRQRGDGSQVEDRWTAVAEGDVLLTVAPVAASRPAGPLPAVQLATLCEEEVRSRLPRLQAAIAVGDAAGARMEAHAIRGVAASFGLTALAEMLLTLEAAARAGDQAALAAAGRGLPHLVGEALRHLANQAA